MKVLLVHPSGSKYNEMYFRLEPLGLACVGQALRAAGHDVALLDLQIFRHKDYFRELHRLCPQAVGFSLNYPANVPEVIDLAIETKRILPACFVLIGGHCGTFIADDLLRHGQGAVDAVVRGEGEVTTPRLLEALPDGDLEAIPGVVTASGEGPQPTLIHNLDEHVPARDLLRKPHKYFIGNLDPCASIEFTRGCPWDCSFCSAWTFYGRSYRKVSPEVVAENLARIREPNAFVVDDVAFIHADDGFAIGREVEKRGIRKRYYLETRCDVFVRNYEVFAYWKRLGLWFLYLGIEAIDEGGLKFHRKRANVDENVKALELARKLGVRVLVNIVADASWGEDQFRAVREWAMSVPEIVHMTINTPYPGTESWLTEPRELATLDYRLFDTAHAVFPTTLPLDKFYEQVVMTQAVVRKHLGFEPLRKASVLILKNLLRGQTNFLRSLWKFPQVFKPDRHYADHFREVKYAMTRPDRTTSKPAREQLYVHAAEVARRMAARG